MLVLHNRENPPISFPYLVRLQPLPVCITRYPRLLLEKHLILCLKHTFYESWFPRPTSYNRMRTAHNATKTTHVRYRCYPNLAEIIRTKRDLFIIIA